MAIRWSIFRNDTDTKSFPMNSISNGVQETLCKRKKKKRIPFQEFAFATDCSQVLMSTVS